MIVYLKHYFGKISRSTGRLHGVVFRDTIKAAKLTPPRWYNAHKQSNNKQGFNIVPCDAGAFECNKDRQPANCDLRDCSFSGLIRNESP
jgi:hypothetical protein